MRRRSISWLGSLVVMVMVPTLQGPAGAGPLDLAPITAADWPMYNHDIAGTRFNPAETTLSPTTVGGLRVLWQLPTPAAVHGTPAVVDDTVYIGDGAGNFYALDATTGTPRWVAKVASPITASALVTDRLVIFGDWNGSIHGLDRATGLPAWPPLRPNDHQLAAVYGSPTPVGDLVVVGISSNEETFATGARPGVEQYPCCSFRGSVVALDPATGRLVWQTYTISEEENAAGSAGAAVWATPTYDQDSGLVYVSTGNNYSEPATGNSDAILALEARTGRIVWKNQLYPNDVWNFQYPVSDEHPDWDFGDSPQVFRLPSGRKVVVAGQKSGFLHLLDGSSGQLLDNVQLEPGGALGGLFADSAVNGGVTYANGSDWPFEDPLLCPCPGGTGHLFAVRAQGQKLKQLWRLETPDSPNLGGTAVANGVVYFITSRSGQLLAVDAATGMVLASVPVGVALSGPSVSRGRVFAGTGDLFGFVANSPNGSVVAFGL
jgi:polyvinyl alcohol dehydrogenase (cytochrome)